MISHAEENKLFTNSKHNKMMQGEVAVYKYQVRASNFLTEVKEKVYNPFIRAVYLQFIAQN